MSELETPQPSGVSRRTVTKAMAWAVPAVAVATAVPAYAGASRDFVEFTGQACKDPGGGQSKFYYFEVVITNSTGADLVVDFTDVEVNGVPGDASSITPGDYTVDPHTECTVTLRFGVFPNSANGQARRLAIRCARRAVSAAVLPVPAPARTSTGPSVVSTASRCGGFSPCR